jgi:hypothetical protein
VVHEGQCVPVVLPQHPYQHRPKRPILLAVDQELGDSMAGETSESARSVECSDVLEDAARPRLEVHVDAALSTLP